MRVGVVLAGGIGNRFGGEVSKQYRLIDGKEVIWYSINALMRSAQIDKIIVVAKEEHLARLEGLYGVIAIRGGDSRNASLKNALDYIHDNFDCEKVIILEAARPMITEEIIDGYLKKLDEYDSVITGQRIVDSLGSFKNHTEDRNEYYLIQAPEAFNFKMLYANFSAESKLTATNQQMPEDSKLYINFDFVNNHKVTYPADLAYCEAFINHDR